MADVDVLKMGELAAQKGAVVAAVPIKVSTGRGTDNKREETFEVEVPRSLADAIKIEGERAVFKRYVGALVINIQMEKRKELGEPSGEKAPRKRAAYLESLGI